MAADTPPNLTIDTPKPRRWDRVTLTLWGLIALAAILRFSRLGHPTLWIDEAATFSRVTGTFEQMLNILRNDGFGPLHYEAYWLLVQVLYPTPWVMRLIPAVAGVLMVPAMYSLARQLLGRHPALVVAAITTCSSYMLFYARDAKMYPHFWLMITLHISSLLWLHRTGRRLAWLCWVATGLGAVGLHATGIFLVAIEPVFLLPWLRWKQLMSWRSWLRGVTLALGLSIILGSVAAHYLIFNQWTARSGGIIPWTDRDELGKPIDWRNSGLTWIPRYNVGQDGRSLTLDTLSAFILGCEWPRIADTPTDNTLPMPWVAPTITTAFTVLVVLLVLGAWPWRVHVVEDQDDSPPRSGADPPAMTWWGTLWILGVWILVPMYGLYYCRSFATPEAPWYPITSLGTPAVVMLTLAALSFPFTARWLSRSRHWAQWIGSLTGSLIATLAAASFLCWQAPWWPASIGPAELSVMWTAVLILAMPVAWCALAADNRARWAHFWRAAAVLGLLFGLCAAIWLGWYVVRQISPEKMKWESIWFPRYLGLLWPAIIIGVTVLLLRLPTRPLRIAAVGLLIGINLLGGVARIVIDSEPPYPVAAADIHNTRSKESTQRVIFIANPGAGTEWATNLSGRYYLMTIDRTLPVPAEFRSNQILRAYDFERRPPNARRWQALTGPKSQYDTLIIWERMARDSDAKLPPDPLLRTVRLKGWREVETQSWRWLRPRGWRQGDWLVRRVFVRESADGR